MVDIDDMIEDEEEHVARNKPVKRETAPEVGRRVHVGTIEHFFDKINVAAIALSGTLKVGDTIEVESDGDEPKRFEVSSMQIDRKDVMSATEGESIGIKVNEAVKPGSSVYILVS